MSQPTTLSLSDNAATRILALAAKDGSQPVLRVTVSGGGCSGFQYGFQLEENIKSDDLRFEKNGATLVTDAASLALLEGSEIDFVDDLMGSVFKVNNPNAESLCGCGTSFSIKF